jgi:hypothetical protein
MLPFLSLLLFTQLHLEWIAKAARAVPILEETATYDFVIIGGGNAYVDLFLAQHLLLIDGLSKRNGSCRPSF